MHRNLSTLAERTEFILGSASPRRRELLNQIGIGFRCLVPYINESRNNGEPPFEFSRRLAEEKAIEVSRRADADSVVLGADTIVVLEDTVLQKPLDERQAFEILTLLSGREHVVCTSLALVRTGSVIDSGDEFTRVFFNKVRAEQINEYVASGEPMDKAGAYGIQGMGAFLVDRLEGNLDNVIGLPRVLLERLAGKALLKL